MKKLVYELGGADRLFEFRRGDRAKLEKEFCGTAEFPGLFDWVYKKVFPLDASGKPTMGGHWESQVAFVHAAIKHNCKVAAREVTREKVEEWMYDIVDKGEIAASPIVLAVTAAWESGIFGRKLVLTNEEDAPKEDGGSSTSD